jgi:hypothetical protein
MDFEGGLGRHIGLLSDASLRAERSNPEVV